MTPTPDPIVVVWDGTPATSRYLVAGLDQDRKQTLFIPVARRPLVRTRPDPSPEIATWRAWRVRRGGFRERQGR